MAKAEIHRKELNMSGLQVIYSIKVRNDGELAGKANILENIPDGMIMKKENNPDWEIAGTTAKYELEEIKPGEEKEIIVKLDWANNGENVGNKENVVEIASTENEAGFEETNKEDNKATATIVIAIGTGESTYTIIAGAVLITLAAITVVLINKKRKED